MKLNVHVLGRHVAVLEQLGDFKSVMTYVPEVAPENLVSLTMPIRTESYPWDDELHPIFRMNLPEGYLLQVLQEEFGPIVGATPIALLSVVGRNMVGRMKWLHREQHWTNQLNPSKSPNSLRATTQKKLSRLVREHAKSGVSGVLPKFLDTEEQLHQQPGGFGQHKRTTLFTHQHIIKGSSTRLPFATANEHLCMQVAAKVTESAKSELSKDGNVLVVHRFDVDENGNPFGQWRIFALCWVCGHKTSTKRLGENCKGGCDHVDGSYQYETFQKLSLMLLMTFAMKNADCHSKNLALRYTSRKDARLPPLTTSSQLRSTPDTETNPPESFRRQEDVVAGKDSREVHHC